VTPFDSLPMVSYYRPIITLSSNRTAFEIWRHIGRRLPKKIPHPRLARSLRIFRRVIPCQILESWGYQIVYISRSCFRSAIGTRGVATGWTGVDMSTPLLPEVVPEIDANPVSFFTGEGGWYGVGQGLQLDWIIVSVDLR